MNDETMKEDIIYKEKCCEGCPDSGKGCRLSCIKLKEVAAQEKPRDIREILKEGKTLFSAYEITKKQLQRVKELEERLASGEMRISVIGQFKRGKSTLINALLGEKVLPVGIVPVTAAITELKYGEKAATVRFNNGVVKEIQFSQISSFVNEQENKANHLGVCSVEIYAPVSLLEGGVTIVDTPGVGSVHQNNTDAAYAYVKESDGAIFMLSVDSPINRIEVAFLENARELAGKFIFAINKIDVIDDEELEEYISYCRTLLAGILSIPESEVQIFPVSAKKGTGVEALRKAVDSGWRDERGSILEKSAKLKMKDIVESALSQVSLYRTALSMPMEEFDAKFAQMDEIFEKTVEDAKNLSPEISESRADVQTYVNSLKNDLSEKIKELFGIDYSYQLSSVDYYRGIVEGGDEKNAVDSAAEICQELREILNVIFMHREENAYVVCRRINDLNRLVRKLAKLRKELNLG